MKQQRDTLRRRQTNPQTVFFAAESNFDVTYLTRAGRVGEEVAVHEVDRKRFYPVLDLA